ncbi:MAG: DUF4105 domain-containing protein, partial [Oxalobacteraceae bacterium]
LLTCTPGDELYSIFGHSAIRITDSTALTDIVFNYGTFNFNDKNFYLKFARGKLDYFLSLESFTDFRDLYQYTGRGITEQVLNLNAEEKIALQNALLENAKEENRYYKYDFFFDNCTTRLRDLILKFKIPSPQLPATMPSDTRFREAIHLYLNNGKQYWSKLGIDVLLGAKTDRVMTAEEQQFLPDNLMLALDAARNMKISNSRSRRSTFPFFLILNARNRSPTLLCSRRLVAHSSSRSPLSRPNCAPRSSTRTILTPFVPLGRRSCAASMRFGLMTSSRRSSMPSITCLITFRVLLLTFSFPKPTCCIISGRSGSFARISAAPLSVGPTMQRRPHRFGGPASTAGGIGATGRASRDFATSGRISAPRNSVWCGWRQAHSETKARNRESSCAAPYHRPGDLGSRPPRRATSHLFTRTG